MPDIFSYAGCSYKSIARRKLLILNFLRRLESETSYYFQLFRFSLIFFLTVSLSTTGFTDPTRVVMSTVLGVNLISIFSTPRTRMPCGAYVGTPSRGVTLGDIICGFFRCVAASVFMERQDCISICVKLSFIDRITGLTGSEYDNILCEIWIMIQSRQHKYPLFSLHDNYLISRLHAQELRSLDSDRLVSMRVKHLYRPSFISHQHSRHGILPSA